MGCAVSGVGEGGTYSLPSKGSMVRALMPEGWAQTSWLLDRDAEALEV